MSAQTNAPSTEPVQADDQCHGQAEQGAQSATPANANVPAVETDPEKMDRTTLERHMKGARRRSKIPGPEGKKARNEFSKLDATFKRRFKGVTRKYWDSVPPPPRNATKS